MSDREQLQRVCLLVMIVLTVAGAAFALWVHLNEKKDRDPWEMEEPRIAKTVQVTVRPLSGAGYVMETTAQEEPFTGADSACEDSFLRKDIPLDYSMQTALYGACLEFRIDYDLALAVIEQETNFRNVAGDGGDSVGFMQIQKRWWAGLMEEIGAEDLWNAEDNFRTGCAILRQHLDRYGNVEDALTAYNSGRPGSSRYSREVMGRMEKNEM
jgi:hypothetical protein